MWAKLQDFEEVSKVLCLFKVTEISATWKVEFDINIGKDIYVHDKVL